MNIYEFEAAKAELARNILNTQSEEVIVRVRDSYLQAMEHEVSRITPCRYSLEEVKQRLCNSEKDAIAGRGLSEEEVEALSEAWL